MNRLLPLVILVLATALALTACSSGPVQNAYTASGDATNPNDLTRTTSFRADDDLNVVVVLNSHSRELPIYAVFTAPTGAAYGTDVLEADETVGEVLLGLDWEAQGSTAWPEGEWRVEVYVDDDRKETVTFTVGPVTEG
jgi:hypothetical protein